jgi:hypothetical protein
VTPINLFGYLRSPEWTISAGLQNDVFAPRIPGMIDQTSALANSGNAGNSYRTQLKVARSVDLGGAGKLTLTGALAEPVSLVVSDDLSKRVENNGRPNVEAHASWAFGPPDEATLLKWPVLAVGVESDDLARPVAQSPVNAGLQRRALAPLLLAGTAQAQTPRPPPRGLWFDPTQLPSYTGRVERFINNPAGETDRLLFREGTQIVLPPTEAEAIRDAVRQGDALTVWGIRARAAPVVVMLAWARAASEGANFVAQPSWFAPTRRGTAASGTPAQATMRSTLRSHALPAGRVPLEVRRTGFAMTPRRRFQAHSVRISSHW